MLGYARVSTAEVGAASTAHRPGRPWRRRLPDLRRPRSNRHHLHPPRPGLREGLAACRDEDTLVPSKLDCWKHPYGRSSIAV